MIIVNTPEIRGKEIIETLGLVRGNTIRAKHIGKDIGAALKHLVGGELKGYSAMLSEAREAALVSMEKEAEKLGADAVVNVRFSTSAIMQGAAEILVYGTAVKIKDK
ncbi:MAG: hypothetical protein PWQ96_468 [Clostridia bacterium]|jgi:uncharacterized protein YbjQ (UPF0145 family)|nr:hypothetical protein [Clostridiales bacterium]MDK2984826.1 hypothetical protein [Clostridia bacterium]